MPSILFVCLHNACRSRIAEAIARGLVPPGWTVTSAGTSPSLSVDAKAAAVLKKNGLRMSAHPPQSLSGLSPRRRWDYLIAMGCGETNGLAASERRMEWLVPDPYDGPPEVYDALFTNLEERVAGLIRRIEAEERVESRPPG